MKILIIAASARALAQSAWRAGITPLVIDHFADEDTQNIAAACAVVPDFRHTDMVLAASQAMLQAAMQSSPDTQPPAEADDVFACVLGGGLEHNLPLIQALAKHYPLAGNTANVYKRVSSPPRLFALLDRLQILHPQVAFDGGAPEAGWLQKRAAAGGGAHVRRMTAGEPLADGHYRQREISGFSASVCFICGGEGEDLQIFIAGYAQHFFDGNTNAAPYRRAGMVSWADALIPPAVHEQVQQILAELIPALKLTGMNGMDFIVDADARVWVLEINARPPASFELHERGVSLLRTHLAACGVPVPEQTREIIETDAAAVRAQTVFYAPRPLTLAEEFSWPQGTRDLPRAGAEVAAGAPLCTLSASGSDLAEACETCLARLRELSQKLSKLLN